MTVSEAYDSFIVAPRAGAWIEIRNRCIIALMYDVAPRAGAWIEIGDLGFIFPFLYVSLPVRERGLK